MKLYNDAFEEKGRYDILHKLGISGRALKTAVEKELRTAYALPFILTALSSWFAVRALEKLMSNALFEVYLASILVIFLILSLFYCLSVRLYKKMRVLSFMTKTKYFMTLRLRNRYGLPDNNRRNRRMDFESNQPWRGRKESYWDIYEYCNL